MDWLQFVSALVSATAWPTAIVVVVCLLKGPILGLIPKIRSFKYGELHIDLTEQLKSLQDELPTTAAEADAKPDTPSADISIPVQVAGVSTRAAMIVAWLEVEKALKEVTKRKGLDGEKRGFKPIRTTIDKLYADGLLDTQTHQVFIRASQLRNEVLHMPDRQINFEDAVAMADICEYLVKKLKAI